MAALLPQGARADTLIDHVNGLGMDAQGQATRFTGLVIGDDGKIATLLGAYDIRPRTRFAVDGHGARLLPGRLLDRGQLVRMGLSLLLGGKPLANLPPPRPEDRDLALATAQKALLAQGITTVVDMGTTIEDWQALRRAGDAGRLAIRVICYAGGIADMALIGGPGPSPWLYDGRLKLQGVWLDAGGPARARPNLIQLKNMMSRAAMDHFQVAVQVAGPVAGADSAAPELPPAALPAPRARRLAAPAPPALPPLLRADVEKAIADLGETYTGDRRWRIEEAEPVLEPAAEAAPPGEEAARAQAAANAEAARRAFAESRLGRIATGLYADFILTGGDGAGAGGWQVWVSGRQVYAAERPAA